MKKVILFALLFLVLISFIYATNITGEVITGEATSQQMNMQIYVQLISPYLSIISPRNETYLKNNSLLLDYVASNYEFLWYNLDNSENITINSSVYFNVSQGNHVIYLYANNTNEIKVSSVYFTTNSSRFIINYSEFKKNGETIIFEDYNYKEIQNLENIILENTNYGKIKINEQVNLTEDANYQDDFLDLDNNIEISQNKIEVNILSLPNFNKAATLWIYNVEYSNPKILKNGIECPINYCQIESFSGNILKFNVTSLGNYSIQESISETPYSGGNSGGGSEKSNSEITLPNLKDYSFSINEDKIIVNLKQGETQEEKIIIKNTGEEKTSFLISVEKVKDLIKLSEEFFELNPGEEKEIIIDIIAKQSLTPDIYLGKLIIQNEGQEKEILLGIEIESKKALFDIKTEIPAKFKTLTKDEELIVEVELYNLGEIKNVDVVIEYYIKDKKGNELFFEHESLAIENRANFLKRISLPEGIKEGDYVLYTKVIYQGEVASASSWFSIKTDKYYDFKLLKLILTIFFGILALSLIIYFLIAVILKNITKRIKKGKREIEEYESIDKDFLEKLNKIRSKIK